MYQMCPMCLKNGTRSKVKSYQINLKEAVWLCEATDCIWPFSSEEVEYISREVGKNWSYNWTTYKSRPNKPKEALQDLILYTPPDTPGTDVCKDVPTSDESTTNDSSNPTVFSDHNYAHLNDIILSDFNSQINSDKYTKLVNSVKSDLIQCDVKNGETSLNAKGVPTVTNVVNFDKTAWQGIDQISQSNKRSEETKNERSKQVGKSLQNFKMSQNGANKKGLAKETLEQKCTNVANTRINFKKFLNNGDSKKYEKFSFDKVVTKKTDNETTSPKNVDVILPDDVEEASCNEQKCNIKTTNDSSELDLESLLNEMSAKDNYCNDQNFDTEWLDSLFDTV